MVLNTCLSFSNEVKNLAKDTRIKYFSLCTHACPYRLAGLGTSLRVQEDRGKTIFSVAVIPYPAILEEKLKTDPPGREIFLLAVQFFLVILFL